MREWLKNLDQIDLDCVYQYEKLLGRKLKDHAEYSEIDKQVDEMILEWEDRKEFFNAYPELRKYAKGQEKDSFQFITEAAQERTTDKNHVPICEFHSKNPMR